MAATTGLAGFLTRVAPADCRTDGELVQEYAAGSDAAFTELVRRFAPLVWGVCRRTAGHRQLAEDAFQATFLVLARKARSVRPSAVGGWLHAVAVHTATRVRTVAHRTRERHQPLATDPVSPMPAELTDPDTLRALDEEIARLPDHLRAAVTLCELDGLSRREAAKRLGIAEGTLSSRLAVARKTLAARLRGRGVALAAALVLASSSAAGSCGGATPPPVSSTVSDLTVTLADGVVRTMFLNKLKRVVAVLAVLVVSVFGSAMAADTPDHGRDRYRIKAPVPKAEGEKEGTFLLWFDDGFLHLKPDGTKLTPPPRAKSDSGEVWYGSSWAPDGERIAWRARTGFDRVTFAPTFKLFTRRLDGEGGAKAVAADVQPHGICWNGDGTKLYIRGQEEGKTDPTDPAKHWVYDCTKDKLAEWKLPERHHLEAISGDGKTAVTTEVTTDGQTYKQRVHTVDVAMGKATPLLEENEFLYHARLSPDGKQLLGTVHTYKAIVPWKVKGTFVFQDPNPPKYVLIDLATAKRTAIDWLPEEGDLWDWTWSVGGKRIAYVWAKPAAKAPPVPPKNKADDRLPTCEYVLTITDPAGKKSSEVYKGGGSRLLGFDWK